MGLPGKDCAMKNKIIYIVITAGLSVALMTGFVLEMMGMKPIDLGEGYAFFMKQASPISLALGLIFALTFGKTYPDFTKTMSKKMLQWSVVGLGFGMTLASAIASGKEGMLFTIVSVFGTLLIGWLIGYKMLKVDWQTSYLISSGTAICGGSAIAATGSVIKAKSESMSVALGVVFVLNAIALFIFPIIGDALGMNMKEFGMWAAIAIHDTSSVVGAGAAFDASHADMMASEGVSALETATAIKLTRALWIVVLAVMTPFFFKKRLSGEGSGRKPWYKTVPMFIVWFVVAILVNTFVLQGFEAGQAVSKYVSLLAKYCITLSLFFIGCGLTKETLKAVGIKPLFQGVMLWAVISVVSLGYILWVA